MTITVTKFPPKTQKTNVFHVTADGDNESWGDNIPKLYIHSGHFFICFDINNQLGWCVTKKIKLGKQYSMAIIQYRQSHNYWFKVIIDDELIRLKQNHHARSFRNVKVYLSDPWRPSFTANLGSVCNLNLFGKCLKDKKVSI